MIDSYKPLIYKIINRVPKHLRDDCFQAACLGLVKALKKKDDVAFFRSYAFACMKSEVISEMARLHDPLPVDRLTFLLLTKYNKAKRLGLDIDEFNIPSSRVENLENLSNSKRISYKEVAVEE